PWKGEIKATPIPITLKAMEASDDPIIQQRLSLKQIRNEFAPIFSAKSHDREPLQRFLDSASLPDFSDLDFHITKDDIKMAIKTANSKSALGPDGITYAFLKDFEPALTPAIWKIYHKLLGGGTHRKLLDARSE